MVFNDILTMLYEQGVRDFVDCESIHRNADWPPRTFRLGHVLDAVWIVEDDRDYLMELRPEVFSGVDFKTQFGERLLNADQHVRTGLDDPVRTVGVTRIWSSETRRKVQISLGWRATIGESWTFLYRFTDDGSLVLEKSLMFGCNTPDSWIDGPL